MRKVPSKVVLLSSSSYRHKLMREIIYSLVGFYAYDEYIHVYIILCTCMKFYNPEG